MYHICFHNGILLTGSTKFGKGAILLYNDKIIDIFNESRFENKHFPRHTKFIDVQGSYICPGFIDTHIHGTGGEGTDRTDEDPQTIQKMAKILPQYGVTSFCPTMYPKPIPIMNEILENIVKEIKSQRMVSPSEHGANILGIHMEGPFISTKRLGVHKPECAHLPDMEAMQHFIHLGEGCITNMTVAPELKGMHEIALLANNSKILLQAGHTDAEYTNILEGMQVGITHSTHFFNAMSRLHHRNPGTVGAILIQPDISCEIIADGFHVHPDIISLLLKNKSLEKIVLITDAITPTMQEANELYANGERVVNAEGFFQRSEDNVIAGSSLTMIQGVRNLVSWGIPIENTIKMASYNPAHILKIPHKGHLIPGNDADMVILSKNLDVEYTIINGNIFYQPNKDNTIHTQNKEE